jgi:hypothetical protein
MSRKLRSANPNGNQSDAQGYHEPTPDGGLSILPLSKLSPAVRLDILQELLNPHDENGNPMPPLITREQFLRLIDGPTELRPQDDGTWPAASAVGGRYWEPETQGPRRGAEAGITSGPTARPAAFTPAGGGSEEPALLTEAAARRYDVRCGTDWLSGTVRTGATPALEPGSAGPDQGRPFTEPGQDRPASTFLARTAAIAPLELERVDWVARLPPGVSVEQVEADLADWGRR